MDNQEDDVDQYSTLNLHCKRLWRQIKDVQLELQSMEPVVSAVGADNDSRTSKTFLSEQILQEHEKRLKAELQALKETELKTLPENDNLRLSLFKQDQIKKMEQLKETLIYSKGVQKELLQDITKEEEAHSSLSKLNEALKKKVAAIEEVGTTNTAEFVLADLTTKVKKATEMNKYFKDILTKILTEHIPTQYRDAHLNTSVNVGGNCMAPLRTIIGRLIEQSLNCPEQPYIDIDGTYWPDHVEFLLRCQIVLKDPHNSSRFKLVPFHL